MIDIFLRPNTDEGFGVFDEGFGRVTNDERNLIVDAVNQYTPYILRVLILLPTLNMYQTRMAYENIINESDETIHYVARRNGCVFFFYKVGADVYQIITNHDVTMVRGVSIVSQLF